MKTARTKNIFRTITSTLNRFFAISAIVALGAGFLGGLEATTPDMKDAADSYMDKYNWYDLDVINYLTFTSEEISLIEKTENVDKIQKAILKDEIFLTQDKKRITARIFGVLEKNQKLEINNFELKEGRFPQNENECLIQALGQFNTNLPSLNQNLEVLENGKTYKSKNLKIVGIVQSPMFFSAELEPSEKGSGFLDLAIYVFPEFFINQNYNHIFLTVKNATKLNTWSEEYKSLIFKVQSKIQNELKPKVDLQIASLNDFKQNLNEIFTEAKNAEISLLNAQENAKKNHSQIIQILKSKNADENLILSLSQISENQKVQSQNQISETKNLSSKISENQVLENQSSEKKIRVNYENSKSQIEKLFTKVQENQNRIFSVETRNQSVGYSSYKDNIEKIASLSKVFPVFFFFIALLVALTTMTRLVEEKRVELGTLKSLGFSGAQLLGQYLLYAFLSCVLGCAFGLILGFKIFPTAVSLSYSMMYTIPLGKMPFRWNIALPVSFIAISVILVATAFACIPETISLPAALMSPKSPKPGKRIFLEKIKFIWNRLSFSQKVTMRNLFRYKKRLWMTLAGVAGCSALLVAGFGLRDSLQDIISIEFNELSLYKVLLLVDDEKTFENDSLVKNFLNDKESVSSWIKVSNENVKISNKNKKLDMQLFVPEDETKLNNFMVLRKRKGHKKILLEEGGIVITEKQSEILGVKTGDFVEIENQEGTKKTVKISGITESYLYSNAYACQKEYENLFGKKANFKLALVLLNPQKNPQINSQINPQKNSQEIISSLMESPNVTYAIWVDSIVKNAHKTISSIDIVVLVVIITSGLLSIIVLYNLANINICERKREIATLLVLGYTEKEAQKYIFREINILSFLGTVAGLFLGGPLHSLVVHATEVNVIMWGRSVHPLSYVYAFCVSLIFTLLVNLMMKKSITKIDMVESLKTKD